MSGNIAELQSQLAAAAVSRCKASPIENDPKNKACEQSEECLFLKKLPIEIRNEIYKLLLVNEDLCNITMLGEGRFEESKDYRYGLSPEILATCRRIDEEGELILYGLNTFIFDTRGFIVRSDWGITPIIRMKSERLHYQNISQMRQIPALRKVKNWKIVISAKFKVDVNPPDSRFVSLCRVLCLNPPRSLEILITELEAKTASTAGNLFGQPGANPLLGMTQAVQAQLPNLPILPPVGAPAFLPWSLPPPPHIGEMLQPLSLFRNVESFRLRAFDSKNFSSELATIHSRVPEELQIQLKSMVTGNSPLKLVFRIYEVLVNYAQAFERHEPFKDNIRASYYDTKISQTDGNIINHLARLADGERQQSHNPHTEKPQHPVEAGLRKATCSALVGIWKDF